MAKVFLLLPVLIAKAGSGEGDDGCDGDGSSVLCNPLASDSFSSLVKNISRLAIEIGIPIAAIFIIYSGLKFVLARGDVKKLDEAKTGLLWAIIGTAILVGAWVITEVLKSTVESL